MMYSELYALSFWITNLLRVIGFESPYREVPADDSLSARSPGGHRETEYSSVVRRMARKLALS